MISRDQLLWGFLFLSVAVQGFGADAGVQSLRTTPDRYLLILDVSSPMRSRANAVRASITNLVATGILGQMHDGDQLGIWTFNNELHTGEFGLVEWNNSARQQITQSVAKFLERQRFSKATDFSKVMPDLLDVVANSRRITVILFSDGDEAIRGTPFDAAIAVYFADHAEAVKEERIAFVTVLRGYQGQLIGHSVSYPPWPVVFPDFPVEPQSQTVTAETQPQTNKRPIVFAEPLIVSGRRETVDLPKTNVAAPTEPVESVRLETNVEGVATDNAVPSGIDLSNETQWVSDLPDVSPEPMVQDNAGVDVHRAPSTFWTGARLAGAGIVVVAVVLTGVLLMRRPRASRRASLITRSMSKRSRPK